MLTHELQRPIQRDVHLSDWTTASIQQLSIDELTEVHQRIHRAVLLWDQGNHPGPSVVMDDAALLNLQLRQEFVLRKSPAPPVVRELEQHTAVVATRLGLTRSQIKTLDLDRSTAQGGKAEEPTQEFRAQVGLLPIQREAIQRDHAEERIAFGVVYEPEVLDTFGTWASADEIARWAHRWLARFQNSLISHAEFGNDSLEYYESYIAPVDFEINGQQVKKGSWLLMIHVLDDDLWEQIKRGDITGYSIGARAVIDWGSEPPSPQ